jgi:hypothetical protein
MRDLWQEAATDDSLQITFFGENVDRLEALEIQNFSRSLATPSEEDPGSIYRGGRVTWTPMRAARFALGTLCALLAVGVIDFFGDNDWRNRAPWLPAIPIVCFGLGAFSLDIIQMLRSQRSKPILKSARETFTIRLDRSALTITGTAGTNANYMFADILRLELRMRKITLVTHAGEAICLPCRFGSGSGDSGDRMLVERLDAEVKRLGSVYR